MTVRPRVRRLRLERSDSAGTLLTLKEEGMLLVDGWLCGLGLQHGCGWGFRGHGDARVGGG